MNVRAWNEESDYVVTDAKPLFTEIDNLCEDYLFGWAYSINTAVGLFYKSEEKIVDVSNDFIINHPDEHVVIKHCLETDLLLFDGHTTKIVLKDVTVWATYYFNYLMIVTENKTQKTFLIDSRGIMFELIGLLKHGNDYNVDVTINRREGYYNVNNLKIYFRNTIDRKKFSELIEPNNYANINKEFNKFIRNNTNNTTNYLYLTGGNNKCGAMLTYFAKQGMRLEVVPNILCDDETINIRIPLDEYNMNRKDVQFLCAKYKNNYSIYGISYNLICGGLNLNNKYTVEHNFYLPKNKESIVYYIVNTLRVVCKTNDDNIVYKKTMKKIIGLFKKGLADEVNNIFSNIILLHPSDPQKNNLYEINHKDYINELLKEDDFESQSKDDLYRRAYELSKIKYQECINKFEAETFIQMGAIGIRISKWKNESDLFLIVAKEYPDAIYQYHCEWLGLQSLDIFIPSLRLGIEYQGEQHYRPVDFFGGEDSFKRTVERDKRKAELCQKHDIKLLYWKYDEVISMERVRKKITSISF